MGVKDILKKIKEEDISKLIDEFIEEEKQWRWRDDGAFLVFLNELIDYIKEYTVLDSDSFLYNKEKNPFSDKENYARYMDSLISCIYDYCIKYNLPLIDSSLDEEFTFTNMCLLLRCKDVIYKVERMCGQGTVDIITLNDSPLDTFYIDYDDIINDIPPSNYIDICTKVLEQGLLKFKETYEKELQVTKKDVLLKNIDN